MNSGEEARHGFVQMDGPKMSYGYKDRSWADEFYIIVPPDAGDRTLRGQPCVTKAICLYCSPQNKELHYIKSSTDDIAKVARKHIVEVHPELMPGRTRGTLR